MGRQMGMRCMTLIVPPTSWALNLMTFHHDSSLASSFHPDNVHGRTSSGGTLQVIIVCNPVEGQVFERRKKADEYKVYQIAPSGASERRTRHPPMEARLGHPKP
ncbi:hypothetical protein BJV74DRAFT_820139 [Russula compacta]|nr:hypothetical protein BJV74DRAFT_820139 [Russula compacta]